MGWGSIHVFKPKNVGSIEELVFSLVEWTLTSVVLSKFPYPPMQLLTVNEVIFFEIHYFMMVVSTVLQRP